jgi:dolichol kinase
MNLDEFRINLPVMAVCYIYIVVLIIISGKLDDRIVSKKTSRKFLHAMIGNLPFIMPFFTDNIYPFLVASPFIIVTFLASPFNPVSSIQKKMNDLADITGEGHHTGLILYAVSYSVLALLYGVTPYVMASGIFPMAYGDSTAALIGTKLGRHKYRIFEEKSLEGSLGMFLGSLVSLLVGMFYFSMLYGFTFQSQIIPTLLVAIVVTVAEAVSPKGLDNIAVPFLGVFTFLVMGRRS